MRISSMRVSGTAAVVVIAGMFATAAPTMATGWHPEPWQPYAAQDFVAPAGKYCAFDLSVEALWDEEEVRVDARYRDGAVHVYEYRGALVSKFTNLSTGESVVRDLSGRGWQELYPDGSTSKSFGGVGPFGIGFRAEDHYPRGYYRLDGFHKIDYTREGIRRMAIAEGPEENICDTLS